MKKLLLLSFLLMSFEILACFVGFFFENKNKNLLIKTGIIIIFIFITASVLKITNYNIFVLICFFCSFFIGYIIGSLSAINLNIFILGFIAFISAFINIITISIGLKTFITIAISSKMFLIFFITNFVFILCSKQNLLKNN